MSANNRLPLSLFLLRIGVFIVMFVWTIDKFVRPGHAAAVYENFYFIGGLSDQVFYFIGGLEIVIILGFLVGFKKRFTYAIVFLLHAVSTLSSYKIYLIPFAEGPKIFSSTPLGQCWRPVSFFTTSGTGYPLGDRSAMN
jgi:hypothetical protein